LGDRSYTRFAGRLRTEDRSPAARKAEEHAFGSERHPHPAARSGRAAVGPNGRPPRRHSRARRPARCSRRAASPTQRPSTAARGRGFHDSDAPRPRSRRTLPWRVCVVALSPLVVGCLCSFWEPLLLLFVASAVFPVFLFSSSLPTFCIYTFLCHFYALPSILLISARCTPSSILFILVLFSLLLDPGFPPPPSGRWEGGGGKTGSALSGRFSAPSIPDWGRGTGAYDGLSACASAYMLDVFLDRTLPDIFPKYSG
jgi:hypothetical protein